MCECVGGKGERLWLFPRLSINIPWAHDKGASKFLKQIAASEINKVPANNTTTSAESKSLLSYQSVNPPTVKPWRTLVLNLKSSKQGSRHCNKPTLFVASQHNLPK